MSDLAPMSHEPPWEEDPPKLELPKAINDSPVSMAEKDEAPLVQEAAATDLLAPSVQKIYRHRLPVRLAHWLNVLCLPILIMSGFQIFNAHPALYWGDRSDRDRPVLSMRAVVTESGERKGVTTIGGHQFDTTGIFGLSDGSARGFPSWATIPSGRWLAMGRQWHLFFAWVFVINGVLFMIYALLSGHVHCDLFPRWRDIRGIGQSLFDHLLLRHPTGEEAKRYNVLQKLAYTGVLFGLTPLIVLTGLSMSPMIDAAFPGLLTLFGGRQSARALHFIVCMAFIGFIVTHVSMVALAGLINNLRSMVTGWFRIPEHGGAHDTRQAD